MAIWLRVFSYKPNSRKEMLPLAKQEEDVKKTIHIMLFVVMILFASAVFAEQKEPPQDEKKISTLMLLKQNWIQPEHGDGFFCEGVTLYWHHKANIGLGMDIDLIPKSDYQRYRAYLTYNYGPWYALAGVSTDSAGKDYAQFGAWYFKNHGLWEIFIDQRLYASTDGKSTTYSDLYAEAIYPIVKDVKAGLNGSYDHGFGSKEKSYDWWFVGPVVYFDNLLGRGITPYFRLGYESNTVSGQKNNNAIDARAALKITF